jgi:predicted MFS family arabinose efflux permease
MVLGLARFGYSILLPEMRADLEWSYAQAGGINTANAVGYLVGAVTMPVAPSFLRERRAFLISFGVIAISLCVSGLTSSYPVFLVSRALAGAAGAVLFVAGATLATQLASVSPSPGFVLGLYFAGVGPGILLSAVLAPVVFGMASGWRAAWIIMGAVTALSLVPAGRAGRTIPTVAVPVDRESVHLGRLRWGIAAFVLFGLGYVSYMTFVVTYYREAGRSVPEIMTFWSVLGLAATVSPWLWKGGLDRLEGGAALATLLGVATVGAVLPLTSQAVWVMCASAVMFGGAFLGVVAGFTQLVRRALPPHQWAFGLAVSTALFAVGQTIGPLATGVVADWVGGLGTGLGGSALILAVAAIVASRQRQHRPERTQDEGT